MPRTAKDWEALTDKVNARLFDDLAPETAFAHSIGRSVRTVRRMKLPTVTISRTRYVVLSKARAKIMARMQAGEPPPRPRGRPRKTDLHHAP
jgi:hypothetical protein